MYLEIVTALFMLCVIAVLIAFKNSIDAGIAGLCISNLIVLGDYINNVVFILSELETSMISYERIESFIRV